MTQKMREWRPKSRFEQQLQLLELVHMVCLSLKSLENSSTISYLHLALKHTSLRLAMEYTDFSFSEMDNRKKMSRNSDRAILNIAPIWREKLQTWLPCNPSLEDGQK